MIFPGVPTGSPLSVSSPSGVRPQRAAAPQRVWGCHLGCGSGGRRSHRMDDNPSGHAAGSARCAADGRRRGETGPRVALIVHATQSTTRRRSRHVPDLSFIGSVPRLRALRASPSWGSTSTPTTRLRRFFRHGGRFVRARRLTLQQLLLRAVVADRRPGQIEASSKSPQRKDTRMHAQDISSQSIGPHASGTSAEEHLQAHWRRVGGRRSFLRGVGLAGAAALPGSTLLACAHRFGPLT
jgi:hypothetical protein